MKRERQKDGLWGGRGGNLLKRRILSKGWIGERESKRI